MKGSTALLVGALLLASCGDDQDATVAATTEPVEAVSESTTTQPAPEASAEPEMSRATRTAVRDCTAKAGWIPLGLVLIESEARDGIFNEDEIEDMSRDLEEAGELCEEAGEMLEADGFDGESGDNELVAVLQLNVELAFADVHVATALVGGGMDAEAISTSADNITAALDRIP